MELKTTGLVICYCKDVNIFFYCVCFGKLHLGLVLLDACNHFVFYNNRWFVLVDSAFYTFLGASYSIEHLNENERDELKLFLIDNSDIFSQNDWDIGLTNVTGHVIDTGNVVRLIM